jgi:hypothetical protein
MGLSPVYSPSERDSQRQLQLPWMARRRILPECLISLSARGAERRRHVHGGELGVGHPSMKYSVVTDPPAGGLRRARPKQQTLENNKAKPKNSAKGFAPEILPGFGSQEAGIRSQEIGAGNQRLIYDLQSKNLSWSDVFA